MLTANPITDKDWRPTPDRKWTRSSCDRFFPLLDAAIERAGANSAMAETVFLLIDFALPLFHGQLHALKLTPQRQAQLLSAFDWNSMGEIPTERAADDVLGWLSLQLFRRSYAPFLRKVVVNSVSGPPSKRTHQDTVIKVMAYLHAMAEIKPIRDRLADDVPMILACLKFGSTYTQFVGHALFFTRFLILAKAKTLLETPLGKKKPFIVAINRTLNVMERATKTTLASDLEYVEEVENIRSHWFEILYLVWPEGLSTTSSDTGIHLKESERIRALKDERAAHKESMATNDSCDRCFAEEGDGIELKRCSKCRIARFCGPECVLKAWKDGSHKRICFDASKEIPFE